MTKNVYIKSKYTVKEVLGLENFHDVGDGIIL